MTLTLATTQTIAGIAGTAAAINYTLWGDEITAGVDDFRQIAQGVLGTSAANLLAPSGKSEIVKAISLFNITASPVTVAIYGGGTALANKTWQATIPANGSAWYVGDGWKVYDSSGFLQYVGATGPQGLKGLNWQGAYSGATTYGLDDAVYYATTGQSYRSLHAGNTGNTPPAVSDSHWYVLALKGDTGATGSPGTPGAPGEVTTAAMTSYVTGYAQPLDADLTAIAGLTTTAYGRAALALADSAAETARLDLATQSLKGLLSPGDKKLIDDLHYDVVADYGWIGNDSNDNGSGAGGATAFTSIMAALPTGARLFFPAGTYRTSIVLDVNVDKRITFQGVNRYASIIKTTSATAHIFHKTVAGWYDCWMDLGFQSSVTRTAGAAINITPGNNVGMNIYRCWMTGMFWGINADGAQSANLSVWVDLDISGVANGGRGIRINGSTINVMIHNATVNAGTATTSACVEIRQSGAVQVTNCDWIQGTNVLLIDSSEASGAGPQACYFTNCFFDQPQGSVIKIMGTRTANRLKFTQCGIAPTGNNFGIEFNGTGVGAVGTQTALPAGISIVDCDIYAQNGVSTGAGIFLNGVGDVNIQNTRVTGFAGVGGDGIRVTPSAGNQTKVRINGCIVGPNSNLTVTNETAIRINAGTIGFLSITDNTLLGNTTAIIDNSTAAPGVTKNINNNQGAAAGLQTSYSGAGITLGTTEQVIMQIALPANCLKVGTTFRFTMSGTATATTATVRVRIGTAGTIADAALVGMGPTATMVAGGLFIEGQTQVTTVGATGVHNGAMSVRSATAVSTLTPTVSGNFNTASALFVSVCALAGASGPVIRTGSLDIISPA